MSVTQHNSLWADASEFGRFIKIETTAYSADNTSSDSNADDYNRFANVATEFYQLKDDGTPVKDSNGNPVPLSEQSGEFVVTRVYGDIYSYNSNNEYTWGGNTTFNFGSNWEENHIGVSDPYVPPDEVFNIPEPNYSNWSTTKTWGNEYSYSKGSEYSWQEGYKDTGRVTDHNTEADLLKTGHFCSYSIGLTYEEAYTVASVAQSVSAAKSNFTSNQDNWGSNSLGLSAASLGVSKSYGDSYEYTCGKGFSIQEGDTEEHVYGTSTSYVHGDSHEYVGSPPTFDSNNPFVPITHKSNSWSTVYGDSHDDVHGDSTETVHGDQTSTVYGVATDHLWGTKNEILGGGGASLNMGGKIEMTLGAVQETTISAKIEIFLGVMMEITAGFKMEVAAGGKAEFDDGVKLNIVNGVKVETSEVKVKATDGAEVTVTAIKVIT
ncbi:MAG TPA: hypothetical protein VFL15_02395 [Gammaproteobacteria bacterium]|nr:hypothetical protein [Gammaproteobacteria bacterium]